MTQTTPSSQRVNTPSVTLYAFHLRDEISKGSEQVADSAERLWERCAALGKHLQIPTLQSFGDELLCFQKDSCKPAGDSAEYLPLWNKITNSEEETFRRFKTDPQPNIPDIGGEIYPLRIHDTCAVDLTLRYLETVEIEQLSRLNSKGCLLPNFIQASIGQTLLIFAEPTERSEDYQALANACIEAFLKDAGQISLRLIGEGRLFGSPIFEYNTGTENTAEQCHILVWFDCHPTTLTLGEKVYHSIFLLLYCRHQILFATHQARLCYQQARELYSELDRQLNNFATSQEETLEDLKQGLKQLPIKTINYANLLREIDDQTTIIANNAENYRSKLEEIRAHTLPEDNLNFLENFSNHTKQFQNQIKVDLRYLEPGKKLFEQMIDAIRGIVEINAQEQAEEYEEADSRRHRNLQIWVAVVAAGIAVSVVSSAVNPRPIESILGQPHPDGTQPWPVTGIAYSVFDIVLHLCLGLALALLLRPAIARLVPKSSN